MKSIQHLLPDNIFCSERLETRRYYVDAVDLLGENMNNLTIKGNTKALLHASKVVRIVTCMCVTIDGVWIGEWI
jgi:hypothetical protein